MMIKILPIFIVIVLISTIMTIFLYHGRRINQRTLKERMINEQKVWLAYNHSAENRERIIHFIQKLEKMDRIEPPFVMEYANFSFLKDNEGEYMGWHLIWKEEGFVTKGIRLRYDPDLSSKIIMEIPFPKDIWDFDTDHRLKKSFARRFTFKIVPLKDAGWMNTETYGTLLPPDYFNTPIFVSLYDSRGKECEPILYEGVVKLIGGSRATELVDPNVKLWTQ